MLSRILFSILLITAQFSLINAQTTISVEETVKAALGNHPLRSAADAVVAETRGELSASLSPEPPQIALEYEGIPSGSGLSDHEEKRLSLSQGLEFPLKTMIRYQQGKTAVDRSYLAKSILLLDLEKLTREVFIDAWRLQEEVKILRENAAAQAEYTASVSRMNELGGTALLDLKRAQVESLIAGRELQSAETRKDAALSQLEMITGLKTGTAGLEYPAANYPGTGSISSSDYHPDSNPETNLTELETLIAGYETKLAAAGWLPDLEISYFQQNVPAENDPDFWGVEFGISVPLWFWIGNRGEIQSAKAHRRITDAEHQNTIMEQTILWNAACAGLQNSYDQFTLFENEVLPLALNTSVLAEKNYHLGAASYLDVVDARKNYLEYKLESVEIAAGLYRNIIQLDRLSGKSIIN